MARPDEYVDPLMPSGLVEQELYTSRKVLFNHHHTVSILRRRRRRRRKEEGRDNSRTNNTEDVLTDRVIRVRVKLRQEISKVEWFERGCNQNNMARVWQLGIVTVQLTMKLE